MCVCFFCVLFICQNISKLNLSEMWYQQHFKLVVVKSFNQNLLSYISVKFEKAFKCVLTLYKHLCVKTSTKIKTESTRYIKLHKIIILDGFLIWTDYSRGSSLNTWYSVVQYCTVLYSIRSSEKTDTRPIIMSRNEMFITCICLFHIFLLTYFLL